MAELLLPVEFAAESTTAPARIKTNADTGSAEKFIAEMLPRPGVAVDQIVLYNFVIPPNYSSVTNIRFRFSLQDITTGSARLTSVTSSGKNTSEATGTSLTTAFSMAPVQRYQYFEHIVSGANINTPVADTFYKVYINRATSSAADTATGSLHLLSMVFDYNADTSDSSGYIWIPANAFTAGGLTGAVLGKRTAAAVWTRQFTNSQNTSCSLAMALPTDYSGDPVMRLYFSYPSSIGSVNTQNYFNIEMARVAPGGSTSNLTFNPVGFYNYGTSGSTEATVHSANISLTGLSTGDFFVLRITRDTSPSGNSSYVADLAGAYFIYTKGSSRNTIILTPNVGNGSASLTRSVEGTHYQWVSQFDNGSDTYLDFSNVSMANDVASNTNLIIKYRIRSAATGTSNWEWYLSSPAISTPSVPGFRNDAFNVSGTFTLSPSVADQLYEYTVSGLTGLSNWDLVNLRIRRRGDTDTLNKSIEILQVDMEYST